MKHTRYIWPAFAGGFVVVLAAMAWLSLEVLRLGRIEARLDRQEAAAEKVRLALWRMDSALMPLLTRESTRRWSDYAAYRRVTPYDLDRMAARRLDRLLLPSPLLGYRSPFILVHFQLEADGKLTSPQVPVGPERELAEKGHLTPEKIEAAAKQLGELKAILKYEVLLAALSEPPPGAPQFTLWQPGPVPGRAVADTRAGRQQQLSDNERRARDLAVSQANVAGPSYPGPAYPSAAATQPRAIEAPMEPLWIGKALVLARRVRVGKKTYIQGCRLNWKYTRTWLLAGAGDLLGQADLKPVGAAGAARDEPNMLATLPVSLLPGEVPDDIVGDTWPVHLSLLIAWACVLVGAGAVAVVLHGVVRLSERRGAFVSAVTHELRTPLTTFRLYTDMLAQGMVTDEDQRAKYIRRLNEEAQRLGHLVENVLAYARLSERSGGQTQTVTLGDLVARSRDRLAARAEQAEMTLSVQDDTGSAEMLVGANVAAVDQILLNLVDNACKFAARADDRTIHIELGGEGKFGTIRVRDHGPGIAKPVTRRLFRPFSKSAQEAARSAAGVGLGLSLSRRLARDFAGDLRLVAHGEGACFELALPAASG